MNYLRRNEGQDHRRGDLLDTKDDVSVKHRKAFLVRYTNNLAYLFSATPSAIHSRKNATKLLDGSRIQVLKHRDPETLTVRKSFVHGVYWLNREPLFTGYRCLNCSDVN